MSGKESDRLKSLIEAVILQAFDDLWSQSNRKQSMEFFKGEGFSLAVKAVGMQARDQIRLRRMIGCVMKKSGRIPCTRGLTSALQTNRTDTRARPRSMVSSSRRIQRTGQCNLLSPNNS